MFYGNSFKCEDYLQSKEAFQKWQSKQNESVDEYILRKRKAELRELVKKVIRDELAPDQQLIVKLHWYDGISATEIAHKLGLSKSTVSRKLDAINNVVYDKLKYALMYRYGSSFSSDAKLIIKNADALMYNEKPSDISQRLSSLRKQQCLSVFQVSEMTGISEKRLKEIETVSDNITAKEIKKLSLFYKVTGDYILFGKTGYCS